MTQLKNRKFKKLASCAVALTLSMSLGSTGLLASAQSVVSNDGKYYSTYSSLDDAKEAAADLVRQVAAEGTVLLKNNNNALPFGALENRVSVFGAGQTNVVGVGTTSQFGGASKGGMTLASALRAGGYRVNPKLEAAYKQAAANDGKEAQGLKLIDGVKAYEQTYSEYNDAAIVILTRTSGEGSDVTRNTGEVSAPDTAAEFDATKAYKAGDPVKKDGVVYKFIADHAAGAWKQEEVKKTYLQNTHKALASKDNVKYKHALMLTDDEEELIQYVEAQGFKKVIVLVNSSATMELGELDADSGIDAMLWIGRPGANGLESLPKLLSGEISPSGKTPDLYFSDLTKDPTWYNFGDNSQTGSSDRYANASSIAEFDTTKEYAVGDKVTRTTSSWSGTTTKYYEFTSAHPAGAWNNNHVKEVAAPDGSLIIYGVEYEEDIYLNYRYAETAAVDNFEGFDYEQDVTYPFGYGLTYENLNGKGFTYGNMKVFAVDTDGVRKEIGSIKDLEQKLASGILNDELNIADIKTFEVEVDVTNNTPIAGKNAVQVYVSAPFGQDAPVQKSKVALVGYEKSPVIQPGRTKTVKVELNVQDLASYEAADVNGDGTTGYVMEKGEWKIQVLSDSHGWAQSDAQTVSFTLANHTYINLDDYTDNLITNLFSKENGIFYTLRDNTANNGSPTVNATGTQSMILMERSRFNTTYPVAPTAKELILNPEFIKDFYYWENYVLDGSGTSVSSADYKDAEKLVDATDVYKGYVSDADKPWLAEINAFLKTDRAKTITQRDPAKKQTISLKEVAGLDFNDDSTEITFRGHKTTPQGAWDEFLNDLTWDQLVEAVTVQAYDSSYVKGGNNGKQSADGVIGMGPMAGQDSPLNLNSSYQYTDAPLLAATFNKHLAEMKGKTIGDIALITNVNRWWGTCVNLHRSPFGGRNSEYHSSDPILTAFTAAYEIRGAQSKGLCCTPKHAVLNEMETMRSNLYTWVSEQAFREIYAKPLQMAVQEGESMGVMGAMNRIGTVHNYGNYNFITKLLHDEWGMKGSYTTDIAGGHGTANPELMIRAGLNDVNNGKNWMSATKQENWDADLRGGKGDVVVAKGTGDQRESFVQYYFMRKSAMGVFYMHANSAMSDNWYDTGEWKGGTLNATQGTTIQPSKPLQVTVPYKDVQTAAYSATGLPEGLTIDATTGGIYGTATVSGSFKINVTAVLDGWVKVSTNYILNVASAFDISGYDVTADADIEFTDGVLAITVGNEVEIDIYSETIKAGESTSGRDKKITTVNYSVAEGSLPAGLALDDTQIKGVATVAGSYPLKIRVEQVDTVIDRWGGETVTKTNFYIDLTIKVTGETIVTPDETIDFRVNEGKLEFKVGDGEWTAIVGENVQTGTVSISVGEKVDGATTITITNADGTTQTVTVNDGVKGDKGDKGDTGATGEQGPAGAPAEGGCGSTVQGFTALAVTGALLAAGSVVVILRRRKSNN